MIATAAIARFAFPRSLLAILTALVMCIPLLAEDSKVLTNDDVIKLVKAGLPPGVIVAKISSSPTDFDTSVDALLALSGEGIPADVLTAMAEAGKPSPTASPPPDAPAGGGVVGVSASAAANVRTNFTGTRCEEPGIYLDDGNTLRIIEPTSAAQTQSGGFMKFSYRRRVGIRGLNARLRTENRQPKFLFCFEESQSGLSYTTDGAVNPSELLLVTMRLDQKQRQRYYVTAKVSKITGTFRSGASSQYLHDLRYERVQPGVFKGEAMQDLPKGEYAFYFAGGQQPSAVPFAGLFGGAGGGRAKLFPFGVD